MKKKTLLLRAGLTFFIVLCIFSAWVYKVVVIDWKPPVFFPVDDPSAEYTIVLENRSQNNQSIPVYSLKYTGANSLKAEDGSAFVEQIFIGKSDQSLDQFVGKSVIVKGDFVYGDTQCIQNACTHFGGIALFDIKSIQLK